MRVTEALICTSPLLIAITATAPRDGVLSSIAVAVTALVAIGARRVTPERSVRRTFPWIPVAVPEWKTGLRRAIVPLTAFAILGTLGSGAPGLVVTTTIAVTLLACGFFWTPSEGWLLLHAQGRPGGRFLAHKILASSGLLLVLLVPLLLLGAVLRQVHAIVGHNGAGKTTLFEAVFGFIALGGGTMQLESRALQRTDVAYLPASLELYPGLTGEETLQLFGRGSVTDEAHRHAAALEVPLADVTDSYSYGTRRKLALIGVLSQRRQVLVLDEPFEALDVVSRHVVRRLLRLAAAEGRLVLFSAHELESLERFCDTVALLQGGRVESRYPECPVTHLEVLLARTVDQRLEALERSPDSASP